MTMDHTQSGGKSNTTDYLQRLDETERERKQKDPIVIASRELLNQSTNVLSVFRLVLWTVYKAGLESSASVHQWNQHSFGRIRSASEVLLKRKLV